MDSRYVVTASNSNLINAYFMGRWVEKSIGQKSAMYTTNLGAQIIFELHSASAFTIEVQRTLPKTFIPQTLNVYIDDQLKSIQLSKNTFDFKITPEEKHVVRIFFAGNTDKDEVWQAQQGLAITKINSNGVMQPIKPSGKTIAFIGDSITAGCWLRSSALPSIGYGADINYASLTAQRLNAIDYRIAYSATGIIRFGTGGVPAAPRFLNFIDINTSAPTIKPDVLIINLGTNDSKFDQDVFEFYLSNFISELKTKFDSIPIVIMVPFNQTFADVFRTLPVNDKQIKVVETKNWNITSTDGTHPDARGSVIAADHLIKFLTTNNII
ncbi:SGNH/GDSL hydrolase family protein [Pediococcus claussenii]|uniref:SGNH/GDSL hydrolase family protein n=1 Tax=Pediococcus claussenii TaxID=187452 RepID=UPI00081A443D|nr:SGNH/GDSL hydrolase family protein [Pediococcus claussenii]ANZ69549.1 hypothetical protein AYR57_04130 [Pediococcus claussenii]ANZ71366.1 hypothetical protein AYR58_04135 [Pediococcus claussenii]